MKGELMNAVLLSVRPQWCEKIANGEKTLEVRKNRPKIPTPFTCYIYCTLPPNVEIFRHGGIAEYANELIRLQDGRIVYSYGMQLICDDRPYSKDNFLCQKVIGEFVCDGIIPINIYYSNPESRIALKEFPLTGLTDKEIINYLGNGKNGYGWHISDLQIYDKPRELSEFWVERDATTDYPQLTRLKRPPQSWCYIEAVSKDEALS